MFEHVFVSDAVKPVRPGALLASLAGEVGLVALAVLVPLLFTEALPEGWWARQEFQPLAPPGRPVSEVPATPAPKGPTPARQLAPSGKLFEPAHYPAQPKMVIDPEEGPAAAWSEAGYGVAGGIGIPGIAGNPVIEQTIRAIPAPAPPAPRESAPVVREARVRVGGNVQPPAPVSTPQPAYPPLARAARIEGVVQLEAVIGTDGRIHGLRVVQGHPLLAEAAVEAVRRWIYRPPSLNGDPVEMVMYVDVRFSLGR